jgi:hypothetical protein
VSAPGDARAPIGGLPGAYATTTADALAEARAAAAARRGEDPLRFCVLTTVALLAWALGPAPVVFAMAALGVVAYRRAVRGGLAESRCVLRRPRLVLLYLVLAGAAGLAGAAWPALRALGVLPAAVSGRPAHP